MRRVKAVLDRVGGSRRCTSLVAVLALALAIATTVHAVVRDGEVLTTTATDQLGAARRAPKVVSSPTTTTTTSTTTTIAEPPPTEPPPVETTAPPTSGAPRRTRPSAPAEPAAATPAESPASPATAVGGGRCLVRLHGKGGSGGGTHQAGDVTIIQPSGNASGWGGRQWLYFAPSSYAAAAAPIVAAVDAAGCGQVIVNGFSNGGAMAMKL